MAEKDPAPKTADPAAGAATPDPTFPTIGDPNEGGEAYLGDFKTREEAESWLRDAKPKLDSFDDWRKESAEREQRLQDTINRLISSAPHAGAAPAHHDSEPQDPAALLATLPDPVEKPDDFRRGLVDGINRIVAASVGQTQSQTQTDTARQQALLRFNNGFDQKFDDLKPYGRIRDLALNEEAEAVRARGTDAYQAYAADPDGFTERVARTTRRMLAEMGIEAKPAGGEGDPPPNGNNGAPPVNRTGGIPGGGGTNGTGGGAPPQATSFVSELQDMQSKSGFW